MRIAKSIISRIKSRVEKILFFSRLPKSSRIDKTNLVVAGCRNIVLSEYVTIGPNALIYCTDSKLIINKKVVIGPGLTIIAGDHNFSTVGLFICDQKVKKIGDDRDVVIESDVWIGCNVTILKGVTIGKGSVVAAGAVVNRSCLPYSIIGGIPAKIIGHRFSNEQIIEHEKILYGK